MRVGISSNSEEHVDRHQLELGFISSFAITKLAGFIGSEKLEGFCKQIINGELSFDEAVQLALKRANSKVPLHGE